MADRAEFERRQIRICRVLCIFFMMSVHVDPGAGSAPIFASGFWHAVALIWVDVLGRASVAALSFISGYLMVRATRDRGFAEFARAKATTLLVPMLAWNLSTLALMITSAAVFGHYTAPDPAHDGPMARIGLWTGLTGPTENLSLFFLRDLFVASLVTYWLRPALRRWPVPVVGLTLALALGDLTAPLIFRPSILVFVAAGAATAYRVASLRDLTRPALALPLAAAAVALLLACALIPPGWSGVTPRATDILRRALLTLGVLALSARLVARPLGAWLARLEAGIFETYLLHVGLLTVLWMGWSHLIGGPASPSYLLFFFAAPVVAMIVGQWFARLTDHFPGPAQIVLRGKARRPPPRPEPAPPGREESGAA